MNPRKGASRSSLRSAVAHLLASTLTLLAPSLAVRVPRVLAVFREHLRFTAKEVETGTSNAFTNPESQRRL